MSVLAYSELLKRISGIDQEKLDQPFKILNSSNTTQNRLKAIKALAKHEPITLGKLLQAIGLPKGGGSYLTIRDYFYTLEDKGLLMSVEKKGKKFWKFTEKGDHLKRYILS